MEANEFRIINPAPGTSPDAALHEEMLANVEASELADLRSFKAAVRSGLSVEDAAQMVCGPRARAHLIAVGILPSESPPTP
jgi:hypothetical protein